MLNPLLDLSARPVIAHRGASGSAPENTLAAFELAVGQGADALELDVRLTADGVPVVLHDATLDRTTTAVVRCARSPWRSFAGWMPAPGSPRTAAHLPFRAADVRIPTLSEVLRGFPEMPLLLEMKEPAAQEAVRRVLLEEGAVGRCVLASEHHAALQVFREPPFTVAASGSRDRGAVPGRAVPAGSRFRSLPNALGAGAASWPAGADPRRSWRRRGGSAVRCTCGR